jgi:hypothetical protein
LPLHWFIPPVVVETDKFGQSYAVSNVEKAGEYLLSWRDLGQGPEWRKALEVCLSAARGETPAHDARAAFEAAACECNGLC